MTANVSCNGGSDGAASVSASGGTAPYTGDGAQAGLTAGTYTYTVTDANGCTASCTVTITEPAVLSASCSGTDVTCNAANDGTTTVILLRVVQLHTLELVQLRGLGGGTYTYTVTDANGCTAILFGNC